MKKGSGWPIGLAAILMATVAGNFAVIMITRDDPSFAVEPDYYRKAVAWDSSQAVAQKSNALEWKAIAHTELNGTSGSSITIDLLDTNGSKIRDAAVSGELLHIARAADMEQVVFKENEQGSYVAHVALSRAGIWELRLSADRESDRFIETLRIDTEANRSF